MKVTAKNGKEYYLVEVIAHILKHLKDELIKKLNASGLKLEATDFDWVITVPAIWRARGKQMMREAGYKVCICTIVYLNSPEPRILAITLLFSPNFKIKGTIGFPAFCRV